MIIQRSCYLDDDKSLIDGETLRGRLPMSRASDADGIASPGMLLSAVAPQFAPGVEGSLLLDGAWVPLFETPDLKERAMDPEGWKTSGFIHGWGSFFNVKSKQVVHVGLIPRMDSSRTPLMAPWPDETAVRLDLWHQTTGCAWRGTPGVAGTSLLRHLVERQAKDDQAEEDRRPKGNRRAKIMTVPRWNLTHLISEELQDAWKTPEVDYRKNQWHRTEKLPFEHTYDATMMYLAASNVTMCARDALTHTGKIAFDKSLSGWWLVEFGNWGLGKWLPDPAGYGPAGPRWVTSPTLELVEAQTQADNHGGFKVLDSWTSKGYRQLRKWSSVLHGALDVPELREVVHGYVYREAWGMLGRPGTLVYRPDWHGAVLATARSNLFRKMFATYDKGRGPSPLRINTDSVTYASDNPDPIAACPAAFDLDPKRPTMGGFHLGESVAV